MEIFISLQLEKHFQLLGRLFKLVQISILFSRIETNRGTFQFAIIKTKRLISEM